jgi:hypothetical protein
MSSIGRVRAAAQRAMRSLDRVRRRTLKRLGGYRERIGRAGRRLIRRQRILEKPVTAFGITVLRHDTYARLKRELHEARHVDEPIDLRSITSDPRHALYVCEGRSFVVDVPLSRCRGLGMRPGNLGSRQNPFAIAIEDAVHSGHEAYLENALAAYYRRIQHPTAAEVLGLDGSSRMAAFPAWGAVVPWQRRTPAEQLAMYSSKAEWEACTHGPVSGTKGAQEMTRLLNVYRSIEQRGFTRELGDVRGCLLLAEDDWACQILDGLHRVAALLVLGKTHVPILIINEGDRGPVRRADVDAWPHVRSGLVSRIEALQVFDTLLKGD